MTAGDARQLGTEASRRRGGRRGGGRRGEQKMVPQAKFESYYGRPVVKPSPWTADIPIYLFLGGVAGGSSLLAAGADLADAPVQRRFGRGVALGAIVGSLAFLVKDLGRPSRFHHMMRVLKVTSPMSVGTWILTAYGPGAGIAVASEMTGLLPARARRSRLLAPMLRRAPLIGRIGGLWAAAWAPAVASYTAVLLTDTATPTWHAGRREMPFVFVGSAAAASGGLSLIAVPTDQAGPARRLAVGGAVLESAAWSVMEQSMGITAEPLHTGRAGDLTKAARALTIGGAVAAVLGRRHRWASALAGTALAAGSACTRFAVFEAGQESAKDPKYTVVPQRERLDARTDP